MAVPAFDEAVAHRWFAIECNNRAWELIENPDRTAEQTDEMIHLAHSACWHWRNVGKIENEQRALCLLASVYTQAHRADEAVRYGSACLALSDSKHPGETPFDRATALECLARAYACAGKIGEAGRFKTLAAAAANDIADESDRKFFESMLTGGDWFGVV